MGWDPEAPSSDKFTTHYCEYGALLLTFKVEGLKCLGFHILSIMYTQNS